jgi:hypothetical protein
MAAAVSNAPAPPVCFFHVLVHSWPSILEGTSKIRTYKYRFVLLDLDRRSLIWRTSFNEGFVDP